MAVLDLTKLLATLSPSYSFTSEAMEKLITYGISIPESQSIYFRPTCQAHSAVFVLAPALEFKDFSLLFTVRMYLEFIHNVVKDIPEYFEVRHFLSDK